MKVQTKWFGEIEVSDDKIITFDKGIIGFEDWKKYTLVYDAEKEENISIIWLQAIDEPTLALPVMKPEFVYETYDPVLRMSFLNLSEMIYRMIISECTVRLRYHRILLR